MKSKSGVWVALIILSVIIGLAGGFFISKFICGEKIKALETELQSYKVNDGPVPGETPFTATNGKQELQSVPVSKIDKNKDWVYDATYEKNVVVESYTPDIGEEKTTTYAKDIVVPYINIYSPAGEAANNEIKKMFDEVIETYNKKTHHIECGYKTYTNGNCVSTVVTNRMGITDIGELEVYTYNFDLESGNSMTYKEVYKAAGFNENNIESKVEDAITNYMKKVITEDYKYTYGEESQRVVAEAISNYKKSVEFNTIKYYLSENGKLNIVVEMRFMEGFGGGHNEIVTVD